MAYAFMALGAISFIALSIQTTLIETAAGIMTQDLKRSWFDALLRQDMAYFDIKDAFSLASVISINESQYKKYVFSHGGSSQATLSENIS